MTEDDLGYVFEDNKIIKTVPFTQFQFRQGILGIGINVPKNIEVKDQKKNVVGMRQIKVPVIISKGLFWEPTLRFQNEHNIAFEEIPILDLRWSLSSIKQFKDNIKNKIEFKKLFLNIKNQYEKNCFFHNEIWHDIHTLWDMGTYFFNLFNAYPIFEMRGFKGCGKTKTMKISRNITFNAINSIWVNPTEATLFRETNSKRPTKYIDEAEKLFNFVHGKPESDDRIQVINSSFEKGSCVPRQEKYLRSYITKYYKTYSPTMVGSINGLYGATEDRAIIHIMTKAPKSDERQNLDINDNDIIYQKIRDDMYWLMFQEYWNVIDTNNNITNFTKARYNFHKNKLKTKAEKEDLKPLSSRDLKIWRPILTLAYLIDHDIFNKIYDFAIKQTSIKKEDSITQGSNLDLILKYIWNQLENQDKDSEPIKIYVNNIRDGISKEEKPSWKTISNQLDKIGFREYRSRDRTGAYFELGKNVFESIITSLSPSFFSYYSSHSSHSTSNCDDKDEKQEIEEVYIRDESEKSVTNSNNDVTNKCDEGDECDECDGRSGMELFEKTLVVHQKCSINDCQECECNKDANNKIYCINHWNKYAKTS